MFYAIELKRGLPHRVVWQGNDPVDFIMGDLVVSGNFPAEICCSSWDKSEIENTYECIRSAVERDGCHFYRGALHKVDNLNFYVANLWVNGHEHMLESLRFEDPWLFVANRKSPTDERLPELIYVSDGIVVVEGDLSRKMIRRVVYYRPHGEEEEVYAVAVSDYGLASSREMPMSIAVRNPDLQDLRRVWEDSMEELRRVEDVVRDSFCRGSRWDGCGKGVFVTAYKHGDLLYALGFMPIVDNVHESYKLYQGVRIHFNMHVNRSENSMNWIGECWGSYMCSKLFLFRDGEVVARVDLGIGFAMEGAHFARAVEEGFVDRFLFEKLIP